MRVLSTLAIAGAAVLHALAAADGDAADYQGIPVRRMVCRDDNARAYEADPCVETAENALPPSRWSPVLMASC